MEEHAKSDQQNFRVVKRTLTADMTPEKASVKAKTAFFNAIQKEVESVDQFAERLQRLAKRSKEIKEEELIDKFMDNLREEISVQLTLAIPDSFKDAIRLARKAESKSTVIASRRKYEDIFSMKIIAKFKIFL